MNKQERVEGVIGVRKKYAVAVAFVHPFIFLIEDPRFKKRKEKKQKKTSFFVIHLSYAVIQV